MEAESEVSERLQESFSESFEEENLEGEEDLTTKTRRTHPFKFLRRWKMKHQFSFYIILVSSIVMVLVGAGALILVYVIYANITDKLTSSLQNEFTSITDSSSHQYIRYIHSWLNYTSNTLTSFNTQLGALLNKFQYLPTDGEYMDMSYYPISYFKFNENLPNILPLSKTQKYFPDKQISRDSFAIYTRDTPDRISLSDKSKEFLRKIKPLNVMFAHAVNAVTQFIQMYISTYQDKLMISYPAGFMKRTERNYDPTVRPWFKGAIMLNKSTDLFFSNPYIGHASQKLMVTISQQIVYKDEVIGVIGGDIIMNDLEKMLQSIEFFNSGFAVLVSIDGKVINRPTNWTTSEDVATTNLEIDSREITGISTSLWEDIKDKSYEESHIFAYENNLLLMRRFVESPKYTTSWILLLIVKENDVYNSLYEFEDSMMLTFWICLSLIFGPGIVLISIVVVLSLRFSFKVSRPLTRTADFAHKIIENAAKDNNLLHSLNIAEIDNLKGLDEIEDLIVFFRKLLVGIGEKSQTTLKQVEQEVFPRNYALYKGREFEWKKYIELLPTDTSNK